MKLREEREREGRRRRRKPDKIGRRISNDEAGGAVVGGGRSVVAIDGDIVGGRMNVEIDPANGVASDNGNFFPSQC